MADWYVSSAVYASVPVWQATHAYVIGDLVKPTAPAIAQQCVFRCTTAGTSGASEPNWATAPNNNVTIASGGATFTNVTSQSTYGWSAAAGNLYSISTNPGNNRPVVGDRVFLSSDHSETAAGSLYLFNGFVNSFGVIQFISVNRSGSVPPVAADTQSGAAIGYTTASLVLDAACEMYWQGITFTFGGASSFVLNFNQNGTKAHVLKNCTLVFGSNAASRISNNAATKVTFDNTTVQFGNIGQSINTGGGLSFDLTWINTLSPIQGATLPTTLLTSNGFGTIINLTARGVDLSALTGNLVAPSNSASGTRVLLDSCRIAPGLIRLVTPTVAQVPFDEIELVNCYDGSNVLNERTTAVGTVTTDRSTYLNNGPQDDIGNYSLKLASNSFSDKQTFLLDSFWLDVENTQTGAAKTATVEILSSSSLNSDDIQLLLEYMGTFSSPVVSFANSLPSVLTTPSALPTSSATWVGVPIRTFWNPSNLVNASLSGSNLIVTLTANNGGVGAISGVTSGKYYWEVTPNATATSNSGIGVGLSSVPVGTVYSAGAIGAAMLNGAGNISVNTVNVGSAGNFIAATAVCVALDLTTGLIWFRNSPSGNWNGSGTANPATGVGGISISSIMTGALYPFFSSFNSGSVATANFGPSTFTGVVPAGFTVGVPYSSGPQQLQVNFTPQRAGRVRGLVRLGKPSAMAWVNPQIAIGAYVAPPAATWDPASVAAVTLSGSNLVAANTGTTSTNQGAHVPFASGKTTGKYYFEVTVTTFTGGAGVAVGVAPTTATYAGLSASYAGGSLCLAVGHTGSGVITSYAGNTGYGLGALVSGDVICVAVDLTNNPPRAWYRKGASGTWNGTANGDPTTSSGGNSATIAAASGGTMVPFATFGSGLAGQAGVSGNVFTANFGATSFVGVPPSGYTSGWPQ